MMAEIKGKGILKLLFSKLNFKPYEGEGEGKGDEGGEKNGNKGTKTPEFKSIEEANKYVEKLEKEKKELLHETMERKEKLRAFEKKEQEAQDALLKEQGKWKELHDSLQPKAKRLEEIEPVLNEIFELEIADVPEEKRSLIPEGTVEKRLKWVKEAKKAKLFGDGKPVVPPSDGGKPNGGGATPEFVSWAADDKRLLTLTPDQYQVWKQHNRAPKKKIAGWGG